MINSIPVIVASPDDSKVRSFPGTFIDTPGRYEVVGIDGFGIINGRAVATKENVAEALAGTDLDPEQLGSAMKGSLTCYLRDRRSGNYYVLADPLGAGIVFYWTGGGGAAACSSSLPRLLSFLRTIGIKPSPSIEYFAILATRGNGGLYPSPYNGIAALSDNAYLELSHKGMRELPYPNTVFIESSSIAGLDYSDKVQHLADEVTNNVEIYAKYPTSRRIAHLTGGLDSRMVFGATIRSPAAESFRFFTAGEPGAPDVIVADSLCAEFNALRTRDPGVETAIRPSSPLESARWGLQHTAGVLSGPANPGLANSDALVLSGGFGELFRGVNRALFAKYGNDPLGFDHVTLALLGGAAPSIGRFDDSILSEPLILAARDRAVQIKSEYDELHLPAHSNALLEFTYIKTRARYYTGEITRSLSRYVRRADPLYSPSAIAVAHQLPGGFRQRYNLQLDVLNEIDRRLVELPFDSPRVGPEYISRHPKFGAREFKKGVAAFDNEYIPPDTLVLKSDAPTVDPSLVRSAHKLGLPAATVVHSETYRRQLRELLGAFSSKEIEATFNRARLDELLAKPARWRPQYRMLRNLYEAFSGFQSL